jgi:threonine dehydrogenase-like Zn-dependent dehydrogenase
LPFSAAIALCPLEAPGRPSCREKNTPPPQVNYNQQYTYPIIIILIFQLHSRCGHPPGFESGPNFKAVSHESNSNPKIRIGAAYLERNMKSLAYENRLVIIGVISGATAELNLAHMMVKRQSIIGSVIRSRSVQEKGQITAKFKERVLPKFADRTLAPLIFTVFPLDQVAEAHRLMEESRHFGKIVLRIPQG